jgi:GTP-binding protein
MPRTIAKNEVKKANESKGHQAAKVQFRLPLKFLTSAADLKGCPNDSVLEVALVGRSNAGKSSMLNGLADAKIAMVSSSPGKTRLLNFFDAPKFRMVDMPGYGFASRSGDEQRSWQKMIEPYLTTRKNLRGLLLVMDIRRDWSDDEQNLLDWISPRELGAAIVLTKIDKLSRSEVIKRVNEIREQSGVEAVFATSALKKTGYAEIEDYVYKNWIARK